MSELKEITDAKIKELFLSNTMTEEKMRELYKGRYTEDSSKIMIDSLLSAKEQMKEAAEKEEIKHRTVRCLDTGGSICESISYMKNPMILVCSPNKGPGEMWKTHPIVWDNEIAYHPEEKTPLPYDFTQVELKRLSEEGFIPPPLTALFDEVYREFQIFIKAPPEILTLLTVFVLESYQQNKIYSLSYLFAMGLTESGKTRIGELFTFMCYRALFASNLNAANVYDFIGEEGEGTCTIIDDEAQEFADDKDKLTLYRQGYKKGAKVRRILDAGSANRTARLMDVFCSKYFAGYYMPYDGPFRERCVPFTMIEGDPERDEFEPEDIKRFAQIRKKLLLSRMMYYFTPLPKVDMSYKRRMKELWKSKIQVVAGLPAEQVVRELAERYKKDVEDEKKISLEAFLTKSILVLREEYKGTLSFLSIWNTLCWILGESEYANTTKFYSETLNRELSKRAMGSMLKSAFGGRPSTIPMRVYTFNDGMLDALKKKFKVQDDDIGILVMSLKIKDKDEEKAKNMVMEMFR